MFGIIIFVVAALLLPSTKAQFAGCDYYQNINVSLTYDVFSPGYSAYYKGNTNCRWIAVAPANYIIQLNCVDVYMPSSTNCGADRIEVARDGNTNLLNAVRYCGVGTFVTESLSNSIAIALRVPSVTSGGRFLCKMTAKPIPCDCGRRKTTRIVNGVETMVNEFTMMAAIIDTATKTVMCGGTVISNQYALTAAHCVKGRALTSIALLVGDHDVLVGTDTPYAAAYAIANIKIHDNYVAGPSTNDIALLKTSTTITFNIAVGPACLPFKYSANSFSGSTVEAAGWGTIEYGGPKSNKLLKVALSVISNTECSSKLGDIIPTKICTYTSGKDTCQFDSGGPLFYTDASSGLVYNVGIVSYGVGCAASSPGVSTRVTEFLTWIQTNTPGVVYCNK